MRITDALGTVRADLYDAYEEIYGEPDDDAIAWLRYADAHDWDVAMVQAKLIADPAYKYSPHFQAKALAMLEIYRSVYGDR